MAGGMPGMHPFNGYLIGKVICADLISSGFCYFRTLFHRFSCSLLESHGCSPSWFQGAPGHAFVQCKHLNNVGEEMFVFYMRFQSW